MQMHAVPFPYTNPAIPQIITWKSGAGYVHFQCGNCVRYPMKRNAARGAYIDIVGKMLMTPRCD